jgi:ribosomal protein S18 acetylase RimI-like enzyme
VTLPSAVRRFWYRFEVGLNSVRTPWGVVATDPRFPTIWDANHARVLEPAPDLTLEEIRAALLPALRAVDATHEHVEFWDLSAESPAMRDLRASGAPHDPDVLMVFEREPELDALPPSEVAVRPLEQPDDEFWTWYRGTRNEFGNELPDDVVDALVERDRTVFAPRGLRFFEGSLDGERAGFASLISEGRVGYVDNVVTAPRFRRRGVASATVTAAVRAGLEEGLRLIHLLAERGGAPSRLYERLGFREVSGIESFTQPLGSTG